MPHCCSHCASLSKYFCSVSQSKKCLIGLYRIQSLCKLDNYGIRDNTLKWIGSFLHNIMQQVVFDGESSSKLPVVSGVPPEVCPGTPSLECVLLICSCIWKMS
jgi:hypothetical protein